MVIFREGERQGERSREGERPTFNSISAISERWMPNLVLTNLAHAGQQVWVTGMMSFLMMRRPWRIWVKEDPQKPIL